MLIRIVWGICQQLLRVGLTGLFLMAHGGLEATAQEHEDYKIIGHYTDENGLPQNSIKSMALQDDYLWLATENGLVRFDGHHFITYTSNNIKGLKGNRITGITRGLHDTLYALTEDKKVIVIMRQPLYVANYNDSLHSNPRQTNPLLPIWPAWENPLKALSPDLEVNIMIYDTVGNKSFLCHQEVLAWYENRQLTGTTRMPAGYTKRLVFAHKGQVFYINKQWELFLVRPGELKKISTTFYPESKSNPIGYLDDEAGRHYFVAKDGLYELDFGEGMLPGFRLVTRSIPYYNVINSVLAKGDTRLIVGTLNNGLYLLQKPSFRTVGSGMISLEKPLSIFYSQTLLPGNKGIFTGFGTYIDSAGNVSIPHLLPDLQNRVFYTDPEGYTWYGESNQLYKQRFPEGIKIAVQPISGIMKVLYQDSDSLFWIITTRTIGYLKNKVYRNIVNTQVAYDSLMGEVNYVTNEKNGVLLFGSAKGIYRYYTASDSFAAVPNTGNHVRFLKVDRPGKIWFTTYGYGFGLLEGNKVTFFPPDPNQYLQFSHCIIEDKKSFFWIPTNKGLFQAARQDLENWIKNNSRSSPYYHYYNTSNGFQTNEFNGGCQPAFLQLPNGIYSLPSMNGLVWFNPDKMVAELPANPIFLLSATLNTSVPLSTSQPIVLPRRYNEVRFVFSSPNWGNIENEYEEYRLTGTNIRPSWQPVNPAEEVLIGQLEGGDYNLEIRKKNGFGLNNYQTYSIPFRVEKLFTETTLFLILVAVALAALLWLISYLRIRLIHQQKTKLRQQVKERTQQLEETNYIKNKLISMLAHDITTPMQFISLISGHLQKFPEQNADKLQDKLKKIEYSSGQLITLADDLLNWMRTQDGNVKLTFGEVGLRQLVEEKCLFFAPLAEDQKILLQNLVAADVTCYTDSRLLGIIIHNIISNAVKFTMKGSVTISTEEKGGYVLLIIQDTGIGMNEEKLELVRNKMEHTGGVKSTRLIGKGIGLIMVDDLARLLNIKIDYQSKKGKGTTVKLQIRKEVK
jgi:signal transduction histidine kinase/ligand-binding sensor domain-containing protein